MAEWIDQLAADALDGDKAAWGELYEALAPRLFWLFRRKGASEQQAEDLVQETWIRILRKPHLYDRGRPFEPYLFVIAVRL